MASRGLPVKAIINLKVPAGVAKPNPKMGQSLGPLGINMMHFCKDFNAQTGHLKVETPMRVRVKVFEDRSYQYTVKPPETSWFVKRAVNANKLSKFPAHEIKNEISVKYIYEIAKIKQELDKDLKEVPLKSICKSIVGQCQGMGVKVVWDTVQQPQPFNPSVKL